MCTLTNACAVTCAHRYTLTVKERRGVTLVQPGGLQQMERGAEGSGTIVYITHTHTHIHIHTLIRTNAQAGGVTLCVSLALTQ